MFAGGTSRLEGREPGRELPNHPDGVMDLLAPGYRQSLEYPSSICVCVQLSCLMAVISPLHKTVAAALVLAVVVFAIYVSVSTLGPPNSGPETCLLNTTAAPHLQATAPEDTQPPCIIGFSSASMTPLGLGYQYNFSVNVSGFTGNSPPSLPLLSFGFKVFAGNTTEISPGSVPVACQSAPPDGLKACTPPSKGWYAVVTSPFGEWIGVFGSATGGWYTVSSASIVSGSWVMVVSNMSIPFQGLVSTYGCGGNAISGTGYL